ncbi:mariner transposase [Plakobranchus ocellatus]|uniref:Mariner transposase n=1 Tax=Plakobranchus ocellatus TaxID=259542 RepID=A0AAV3ZE49_9GAST|nr:mariner transposase [Plakobranchus ocellatus]
MATSNDLLIKQRSVIEFLAAVGCSATKIHARMKTFYRKCAFQTVHFANGKFKVVASARKILFTVFWDMEGVVHMDILEQGQTVNSERNISTLQALKCSA